RAAPGARAPVEPAGPVHQAVPRGDGQARPAAGGDRHCAARAGGRADRAGRRAAGAHRHGGAVRRRDRERRPVAAPRRAGRARPGAVRGRAARRLPHRAAGRRARLRAGAAGAARRDGRGLDALPELRLHRHQDHRGEQRQGRRQPLPRRGAPRRQARAPAPGHGRRRQDRGRRASPDLDLDAQSGRPAAPLALARVAVSEDLYSPSWYRVANLRPRLRGHVRIHRHHYRGELWYVLEDRVSRRMHRFNPQAHYVIGLMDGRRTVQALWDAAIERFGDDAPTQDEVIRLLGQLHAADVLQTEMAPDVDEILRRAQKTRQRSLMQKLSPLALRIPLVDPERFLERWLPYYRWLFGPAGALLWLMVVGTGLALATAHWRELTESMSDRVLAPRNLLLLALTFPLVKLLHELGHACATKAWGGEVHDMGVMLLVLMPVPYVDATASSAFRETRRRVVVGAAGILVETFVASLALFVWLQAEPGTLRAMLYDVMLIAGVSTVVFNGNPLLRFDGYYILADLLQMPNL